MGEVKLSIQFVNVCIDSRMWYVGSILRKRCSRDLSITSSFMSTMVVVAVPYEGSVYFKCTCKKYEGYRITCRHIISIYDAILQEYMIHHMYWKFYQFYNRRPSYKKIKIL